MADPMVVQLEVSFLVWGQTPDRTPWLMAELKDWQLDGQMSWVSETCSAVHLALPRRCDPTHSLQHSMNPTHSLQHLLDQKKLAQQNETSTQLAALE